MDCKTCCFFFAVPLVAHGFIIIPSNDLSDPLPPTCDSQVYCQGDLLHDVQTVEPKLFNDSKTFVDMKLLYPADTVVKKYAELKRKHPKLNNTQLQAFVNENFEDGDELEPWKPQDFNENPKLARQVSLDFKKWVLALNELWLTLGRKMKDDVKTNPTQYSLIHVPNGFIIPGGRFRELYYWDTFWIINGLLLCDMRDTARGVIENLISLVRKLGFMPNGSRVYYMKRTQPPLLIQMADSYYKSTDDFDFITRNIKTFEEEFHFWEKERSVVVDHHKLYRYYAPSAGPRPESYREDYKTAQFITDAKLKNQLYMKLKSAAESGWDFSSRWIISHDGSNKGSIESINTPFIVPVDLNCFIHRNALILASWFHRLKKTKEANQYQQRAEAILEGINAVLWNDDIGIWQDYDLYNNKKRNYFYLSNFTPLWTQSYKQSANYISKKVLAYMSKENILQYIGGTPMSQEATGEQWDLPNAWPPYEAILIQGLNKLSTTEARNAAKHLAHIWLKSNYIGWINYNKMFEKYNVNSQGQIGNGGEYTAQYGFGWTNGVVLQLLSQWKDLSLSSY